MLLLGFYVLGELFLVKVLVVLEDLGVVINSVVVVG